MVTDVNHIGLVVKSIDDTFALWEKAFGAKLHGKKEFPQIGQNSALISIGSVYFELMEPVGEEGTVPKFLATRGEGLHHISLKAEDMDKDFEHFESCGLKALFHNQETGFISPKGNFGVLCEVSPGD